MFMEENIIAVRRKDIRAANVAFAELMGKTEDALNEKAKIDNGFFKGVSASELERISCSVIKDVCSGTPFRAEEVRLVSGAKFPDIMAETYYGVEVKSTIKDHWTSTGSSIVESTRDELVENIYMLFGKFGGSVAEFKCRPYQDVLYEIAVTHCPRYLINMELGKGETIFDRMGVTYDELRTSGDTIGKVRRYYKAKAKAEGRVEMPWWLGDGDSEDVTMKVNVRFWRDLSYEEKINNQAQIFILFPEVLGSNYDNASLWLCTTRGVLNPHIRDTFTAGGTVDKVNGEKIGKSMPQIYKQITKCAPIVKSYFRNRAFIEEQVREFNPRLLDGNMYDIWISQILNITNDPSLIKMIDEEAELS